MPIDRVADEKSRQHLIATFELRDAQHEANAANPAILAAAERIGVPDPSDPAEMEATLTRQVMELDAIFAECGKRAARDLGGFQGSFELYMSFALKSQAQCRAAAGQAHLLRRSRSAQTHAADNDPASVSPSR